MILFAAIVPPLSAVQEVIAHLQGTGTPPDELLSPHDVVLPIARFGNTTQGDTERLVATLTDLSDDWTAPGELSFAGGQVVTTPSERTLELEVAGDVGGAAKLATAVKEAAQHRRFLLDRRDFRPFMTLATVRAGGEDGFDAAAGALGAFEGQPWSVGVVSMRKQTYGHPGASEEVATIPLGAG